MNHTHWTDTVMAALVGSLLAIGPDLGHYALMIFGAAMGTMHSVAKTNFGDDHQAAQRQALWYMLKWIGTACVLTHATSAAILQFTGFPADRWPGVVAFMITFLADKWPGWITAAADNYLPWRKSQ